MSPTAPRLLVIALAFAPLAAACTDNAAESASSKDGSGSGSSAAGEVSVRSTDNECTVDPTTVPRGNLVFHVDNKGDRITEFYLLAKDGVKVVGEVENIGPGLSRDLVVRAEPGSYLTACKPGMTGDGIRATFTVTYSGDDAASDAEMATLEKAAAGQYKDYVSQQATALLSGTTAFAAAYEAGNDDQARALYAPTRAYWESIEPVAESFGDLDPRLDLREADLEEGQTWTGWHRIEKDLWPPATGYTPATPSARTESADQLVSDTQDLVNRVKDVTFTPDQLGNGAKELLDEVATGKVTGEEEAWSHTDLWDFQANVDGARLAYQALRPIVLVKDPDLADTLDARFTALHNELNAFRTPDGGFLVYSQLTPTQVKQLADSVNALSEPLSKLTSVVVL